MQIIPTTAVLESSEESWNSEETGYDLDFNFLKIHHRVKNNEREMRDKYFDLARELRKQWNIKMTVIPMVIGALGRDIKDLGRELEELEIGKGTKIIQTTALFKSAKNAEKSPGDLRRLAVT